MNARKLFIGAFVLCVWVARWSFPESSAAPVLDPSFMQALGYALVHGMQFGTDIVYTYGPLGWFNVKPHQPELYWTACLAWELAFKLILACFFAAAALRSGSRLALVWLALVLVVPDIGHDAYFFLSIVTVGAWALARAQRSWPALAFALLVLVLIALVKFTYTIAVLVAVACIALEAGRRNRARGIGAAGLFLGLLVATWWALGQSPANLPAWFQGSTHLALAFSAALSVAPSTGLVVLALCVAVASLVTLLVALRGSADRTAARIFAALWVAVLFIAWKAGFTRALGNEITFFAVAAAAPFLLPAPVLLAPRGRRAFEIGRAVTSLGALCGFCAALGPRGGSPQSVVRAFARDVSRNVGTVVSLAETRRTLDAERLALAHKYALPRTRAAVGDATVDVFGSEQGFAFLNDLTWHPRPVFQAFSVMNDALSRANARFLEGPDAPRFMLYAPSPIDGRLESMEDARSLHVMMREYRPLLRERGMMLFERRTDLPRADRRVVVLEREIAPGETLELSGFEGNVLLLELDAGLDVLGKVQTLALGAPPLYVEIETTDGIRLTERVVPAMIEGGAVVRPWLQTSADWVSFVAEKPVHAIARLRFVDPTGRHRSPMRVRVVEANALQPAADPDRVHAMTWSMFTPPPTRVAVPKEPDQTMLRGYREAVVVNTPSALTFALLSPGKYRLQAQCGILPDAWRAGRTDGAIVRVERRGAEREVLWERALDPARNVDDGKMQTLDLSIDVRAGDEIVLATDPGPFGDAERDWVFWTEVSFTRVD